MTVRKLIAFDDETFDQMNQLASNRMATLQELADEAFNDVLKKHGIPIDLKDALHKSVALSKPSDTQAPPHKPGRKKKVVDKPSRGSKPTKSRTKKFGTRE